LDHLKRQIFLNIKGELLRSSIKDKPKDVDISLARIANISFLGLFTQSERRGKREQYWATTENLIGARPALS